MPYSGSHATRSTNWKPGSVGSKRWNRSSESRKVAAVLTNPTRRQSCGGRARGPGSFAEAEARSSRRPVANGRKVTQESRLDSVGTIALPEQPADEGRRARDHEEDVAL